MTMMCNSIRITQEMTWKKRCNRTCFRVRVFLPTGTVLRGGSTFDAGNDLNADWRSFLDHYSLGRSVRWWGVSTSTAQSYPSTGSHLLFFHLDHCTCQSVMIILSILRLSRSSRSSNLPRLTN